jgi:hypothetical protein
MRKNARMRLPRILSHHLSCMVGRRFHPLAMTRAGQFKRIGEARARHERASRRAGTFSRENLLPRQGREAQADLLLDATKEPPVGVTSG